MCGILLAQMLKRRAVCVILGDIYLTFTSQVGLLYCDETALRLLTEALIFFPFPPGVCLFAVSGINIRCVNKYGQVI